MRSHKINFSRIRKGEGPSIYFLIPSLAGITIFVLLPFGDVIRRSFFSSMRNNYVGLSNYVAVFYNDAFRLASFNTIRFFLICIPMLLVLSLVLALIIYTTPSKLGIFKTTFLSPMAIPIASIVLLWRVLFSNQGLANNWLSGFEIEPINWMNSDAAFWVLIGSYIWKNIGYGMILWLAGLANINESLYEAAKVDGAGAIRIFFYITLPHLLTSLYTIMVLSLINGFKVFREAYLVAGDYPHKSIYLLQHLFNNWFRELSMDRLSAAAVVTAVAILLLISVMKTIWDKEM